MAKIEKFEDIKAWQNAREPSRQIYDITSDSRFAKDFALRDQVRREAVSTMSNIAEGFARQTDKEFMQFLHIALGSVTELQSQLYVAQDLDYISGSQFKGIQELSTETAKLIMGFIKYLRKKG